MTSPRRPIDPEVLLENTGWVRELARGLLADGHRADDVVQSTLVAAIERPPHPEVPLRPWLARVARNFAFQTMRSEKRRARHENVAPPRPAPQGPDEIAARADTFVAVVAAVRALEPDYRDAVVLRYFDGLESTEVAARLGIPVETARTRLKRALGMLRNRLDRDYGGDGRAWAIALLPLVTARDVGAGTAGTAAAASAGRALVTGGAIVGASAKVVAAAVVAGGVLGGLLTAGVMSSTPGAPASAPQVAPPTAGAPRSSGGSSREDHEANRGSPVARPSRGERRADGSAEARPAADAALAAWIDTVDLELPPAGTGTITGHVHSADGKPVAGATVRATRTRAAKGGRGGRAAAPVTSIEESVRAAALDAKWRVATTRDAISGADGSFTLAQLTDGPHWLGAWAEGWQISAAPGAKASDARPGAVVNFVARALILVPVTILTPDGSPSKERVLVRWALAGGPGQGSAWWDPADGLVQVDPGDWTLTAEVGDEFRSEPVPARVTAGGAPAAVTLRLAVRTGIAGTIAFEPGDDVWKYVHVSARRRDTGDVQAKREGARPPDWKFRFNDLDPGEYEVVASLDGGTALASAVVRVTAGTATANVAVPRLGPDQVLAVRVLGPDGAALGAEDVDFEIREARQDGNAAFGARGVQRPDGALLVPLRVPSFGAQEVRWSVVAKSKKFGAQEASFERGKPECVEIRFASRGVLRPTIAGAESHPLASRLRVTLAKPGEDERTSLVMSRRGPAEPVEPGTYTALLWLVDEDGVTGRVLSRTAVDLRAGENPVTIRVPEVSSLRVRIPGAVPGTKAFLSQPRRPMRDVDSQRAIPSADGTVTFENLPAGPWLLSVTADGATREMVVRVPAAETTFSPGTIAGFTVHVTDEAGFLATSGFRTGDVILSIADTQIDTFASTDHAIYEARESGPVPIEVQRGGTRLTLSVDAGRLWSREDHGGWWDPVVR